MFQKYILDQFLTIVKNSGSNNAFCINEKFYAYEDLARNISKIRKALQFSKTASKNIGLIANDDIETYASIFAIWLEGSAYVPIHPHQPFERCLEIISQANIDLVINSSKNNLFSNLQTIESAHLEFDEFFLQPEPTPDNALAYILFTSGSTGKPKGVTITRGNIRAFVDAFWNIGYSINENDRILQPFDLTFDLSVMSYLIPLLKGACAYTVSHDKIKYSYIAQLLDEQSLTVALMVPSAIRYLRPYFDEIELPALRYNLFCGEALPLDLINEWSQCVPNAFIDNVYGPTEDTIFCSHYRFNRKGLSKSYNGILSIGKSMTSGQMIIVNDENLEISEGQQGELCLSGGQLTPGYWNNPEKNNEVFFTDNQGAKFYKTGDICFKDSEGDIMYSGRSDNQVKVQGYRVELGEIEHYARESLKGQNAIAIAFENLTGNMEIALFVESELADTSIILEYLKSKMPYYMVPAKILLNKKFPLNSNGKTDRIMLKKLIEL
jgi:D-alanine--poly(phosphoribitol) ligase subunit 1